MLTQLVAHTSNHVSSLPCPLFPDEHLVLGGILHPTILTGIKLR